MLDNAGWGFKRKLLKSSVQVSWYKSRHLLWDYSVVDWLIPQWEKMTLDFKRFTHEDFKVSWYWKRHDWDIQRGIWVETSLNSWTWTWLNKTKGLSWEMTVWAW